MRLKFGECVLDLGTRQLQRAGNVVPLEPKVPVTVMSGPAVQASRSARAR